MSKNRIAMSSLRQGHWTMQHTRASEDPPTHAPESFFVGFSSLVLKHFGGLAPSKGRAHTLVNPSLGLPSIIHLRLPLSLSCSYPHLPYRRSKSLAAAGMGPVRLAVWLSGSSSMGCHRCPCCCSSKEEKRTRPSLGSSRGVGQLLHDVGHHVVGQGLVRRVPQVLLPPRQRAHQDGAAQHQRVQHHHQQLCEAAEQRDRQVNANSQSRVVRGLG